MNPEEECNGGIYGRVCFVIICIQGGLLFFVAKPDCFVAKCKILSQQIVILYRNQKRKYYD